MSQCGLATASRFAWPRIADRNPRGVRAGGPVIAGVIPAAAGVAAAGALALGIYYPNSWLFGRVIGRGPREGKTAYLTFDDGPNPTATDSILETLAAQGVPAAFFMVGAHVQRHPDIVRRVVAAGHEVGNHTQHHIKLHVRGPRRIRWELEEAHRAITSLAGTTPRMFRAPHGYRNPFVAPATGRLGYQVFGWTFGVWGCRRPARRGRNPTTRARTLAPGRHRPPARWRRV